MIIYLYVKTHNKTGLKYLGKTTRDPYTYNGSGKDWIPHLKEHGVDIRTDIIKECLSNEELSYWGRYYSVLWNVVDSNEWANRIPETGGGGTYRTWDGDRERQAALTRASNLERVKHGTHNLLGDRNPSHFRIEKGTHNFQGLNNPTKKKIANGTYHMLQNNNPSKQRVDNGTHNFLGERNPAHTRVENGTHNWLGPVNSGHPTQLEWTCPHCSKSGKGKSLFNRWHGNNCKLLR